MNNDITQRLWSWSVHTGDSLFAEAAGEIERLQAEVSELSLRLMTRDVELDNSMKREQQLTHVITEWADADDGDIGGTSANRYIDAQCALRRAIGR